MVYFPLLIASLLGVQAHLSLKVPAPRGDDFLGQLEGPCGGFNTPGARTQVEGGKYSFKLGVGDPDAKVDINLGIGANVNSFPTQIFTAKYGKAANQQIDLDFTKAGVTNGPVSIQIIQDGKKFMCVDFNIKSSSGGSTQPTSNPNPNPKPTTVTKPTTNPKPNTDKPQPTATNTKTGSVVTEVPSTDGYSIASGALYHSSALPLIIAAAMAVC